MKNNTYSLFAFFIIAAACLTLMQQYKKNAATIEQTQHSGAYEALNFFGMSRAYPNTTLPANAHYAAWKSAKEKSIVSRTANTAPWEAMGPKNRGGRTLELTFNPQNYNTIYAGSASGGLWRSYSGGAGANAWEYVPTGFPVLGVSAIAFAPADSMVIYIGTGEVYNVTSVGTGAAFRATRGSYGMGILKSTDGGVNWEKSLDWSYDQNQGIWDIKVSTQNPNKVFTATTDGIYRSEDAGQNWTQVLDVPMANSLLIDPDDDQTLLVGCGNFGSTGYGIYRTTDNGVNWQHITAGLPNNYLGKIQLAQAPSASAIVYASIGNGFGFDDGATWLCRSDDFGTNWTIQSTTDYSQWQGWFSHDVAVSPTNPDHLIAVGIKVWRSTDGGVTLEEISDNGPTYDTPPLEGPDGPSYYVHSDSHDVIYHPTESNRFYVASDGGVHHSEDHGDSFYSCVGGYQTVQFYNGFSNSSQDSIFCIGGLQDNGTIVWEGDAIWTKVYGGDGSWTAVDPTNDQNVYVSSQNLNIRASNDQAESFYSADVPNNNEYTSFIAPFVVAPSAPNILYAGRSRVYKTENGGNDWTPTNAGFALDNNPVLSLTIFPENEGIVYAATAPTTFFGGTRGHVFITTDGGDSWTDITGDLPDRYPMDMTVDPTNAATAYITFSGFGTGHVFKTEDFGTSWTDISQDLPDVPTNAVIVDPLFPDNVYIGNDLGVFASVDGGETWQNYQEGLFDAVMIFDLKISPTNRKLRAATHGNGAFQRDLLEDTPSTATVNSPVKNLELSIFPNPATDQIMVQYSLKYKQNISVELFDTNGRLIKNILAQEQHAGQQELYIKTSGLQSGNYYLRVKTADGVVTKHVAVM